MAIILLNNIIQYNTKLTSTQQSFTTLKILQQKMILERVFQKIADFNYKNRVPVLIASIFITLALGVGMFNLTLETDPQNLWVSHDSIGYEQQMNFNDQYGAFFRTQQIILAQNNEAQQNIFTRKHLYTFYFLLTLINKKSVNFQGRNIKIDDLCFRPIIGKGCYRPSPLDLWKMNITDINADQDIQYTALCIDPRSQKSRIPCSDQNQIPIIKQSIYGGITCDDSKDKTTDKIIPCEHCWVQAKAMMATYLLNNDQYTGRSAQQWQKSVLIDSIHKFNADNGSFIQEYSKYFDVKNNGEIQFENGFKLNMNDYTSGKVNVHFEFLSERSIPDQLVNQTNSNFLIVVISYTAMFIYIGVAIGQFPSLIASGFTLAVTGILIVLASIVASMGIMSYLGVGFTMISAEVIPFLVLAIGIDNMFMIKGAVQRADRPSVREKFRHALMEVGPSITTATICQTLAFLVGALTKMPALQTFCIQSALALLFSYFLEIFTFVVVLLYDEERKNSGRADLFCCIKTNREVPEPRNFWKKIFGGPYYRLLLKNSCQFTVLGIAGALFILAAVGIFFVPVGLNEQVSMQVNSDLYNYFTYEKKYIEIGPPAYIVLNSFDFQNDTHIKLITDLNNQLSRLEYIQPPVYSWFASFKNFKQQDATWSQTCGSTNIDTFSYQDQLKKFLAVSIQSACCQSYGICGQQYNKDLIFNDDNRLISSRLRVMHKPLRNSYDYIKAARETRMTVDYVLGDFLKKDTSLSAYPYSLFYVYYDQYSYIRSVAIQNLLLAIAVVFLVVTLMQNIKIAGVICSMVLLTTFNLIGFVYLLNSLFPDHGFIVEINAISVVNLITCVGLSVEFTAHICISLFKLQGSQQQKLQKTLENTGSSVFIGIGLTKYVGVLILGFAKSTLFRLYYFRMYMGIILLGLFNGLVLLPVILYKWGPKSGINQDKKQTLITTMHAD